MAGTKKTTRDLVRYKRAGNPAYEYQRGIYASSLTGGIQDALALSFLQSQSTTSFRSGGTYGETVDNPREILAKNEQHNRFPFDIGNEFKTTKTVCIPSKRHHTIRSPYHNAFYQGPLIPLALNQFGGWDPNSALRFHLPIPAWDETVGPKALRLTRPNKSVANLSQALLELVLDLPRIPYQAMAKDPLNLRQLGARGGAEYLNVVFGWAPLVSDVLKICKAIVNSEQIIKQYVRDAGRNVRRSIESLDLLEKQTSWTESSVEWALPRAYNGNDPHSDLMRNGSGFMMGSTIGDLSVTETTRLDYRFSGAWTYYLDGGSTLYSKLAKHAQLADKVLGLKVTLETLWEISPWTWLVDWFVNIGDIIAVNNALASDSLVLRYGYLTRKTTVERTYSSKGVQFPTGHTGPVEVRIKTTDTERRRANPYGFGINWSALTVQQLAILAALGMTNGNNSARWG